MCQGKSWCSSVCSDSGYNSLAGRIPPALGKLPSIRTVILEHNTLTGTVPASFFASTSLKTLYALHARSALSALCAPVAARVKVALVSSAAG